MGGGTGGQKGRDETGGLLRHACVAFWAGEELGQGCVGRPASQA